jgi:beta-propeller repeat-containing protein
MRSAQLPLLALALACSKPQDKPQKTAETVAWNAPGIAATQPGRYAVRDGPVAASFSDVGFALAMGPTKEGDPGGSVRWTLAGAKKVVPRPQETMPGRVHDLRGDPSQWKTDQPTYGRLVYADVYPGVTLTVETRRHGVSYRFDLAPGADPGAIRMLYAGADEVAVEDDGRALRIRAGRSSLREGGLHCYQQAAGAKRDIPCRYAAAKGSEVVLSVGARDPKLPLVIDPEIAWSSYLGGANADYGRAVAADSAGNVYVTGYTYSSDFPAASGFDAALGGATDAFVTKVGVSGSVLLWSTYLGGSADDHGYAISVDAVGDAYVAGDTESSDFPSAGNTRGGSKDAFVAKLDPAGALAWSSYLGGSGSVDVAWGIAVDPGGGVTVVGHTDSPNFPTAGGFDAALSGGDDGFVTRVSAAGNLVWSSFLGGNSDDFAYAVAVDAGGDAYVTGYTLSSDFPSTGGFDTSLGGTQDAFVTKVDVGGSSLAWSSFLGGSMSDTGRGVAVDSAGNVYVTGDTTSTNFPTTGGFDTLLDGALDAFVAKVDASGSLLAWSSFLGGLNSESGSAVTVDAAGGVEVVGYTQSPDFPAAGGFDPSLGGTLDAFVVRVDPTGASVEWGSYLGGSASEEGFAIALDPIGDLLLAGRTYSTDFPAPGGFATTSAGGDDAFVLRIPICGNGVCDAVEDACGCPADCGADSCGNGCCGPTENECTCPADCGPACADGCCGASENQCTCPDDCGGDSCGNGCCGPAENECTCPADCTTACGDGCCGALETACGCPEDCGADSCGNGCCGALETACGCPEDCGADSCGNGCCGAGETACDCPADCGDDYCNNGCCGAGETACDCPDDCADRCGDGCCRTGEDCSTCPDDCGPCGEPAGGDDGGSSACGCRVGERPYASPFSALWPLLLLGACRRRASRRRPVL